MENVCNAIFEEPAIVGWERREDCGVLAYGGWVKGWCGAYPEGHQRVVIDSQQPASTLVHDLGMLPSTFLPFVLVSFVHAQLIVQGDTELELGMTSVAGSGIDCPGHIPLDIENYPVAPSTLQLEQVYLFVRHGTSFRSFVYLLSHGLCVGERTPVSKRMSEAPANIPPVWLLCEEGRKFEAAVANLTGSGTLHVERVVEKEDGSLEPGEW
jgi:hypothetical protein